MIDGDTRHVILGAWLAQHPSALCVTDLAVATGLSVPKVAYHVRKLRAMSPVAIERVTARRGQGATIADYYRLHRATVTILRSNGFGNYPNDDKEHP